MAAATLPQFIDALRKSDQYIEYIYTQGGCYQFYLLCRALFPECRPRIRDITNDHVAVLYQGKLYDIRGAMTERGIDKGGFYRPMTSNDHRRARRWSFHKNNVLKITDCPFCEEEILV